MRKNFIRESNGATTSPAPVLRVNEPYAIVVNGITAIRKNSIFLGEKELSVGETYREKAEKFWKGWINSDLYNLEHLEIPASLMALHNLSFPSVATNSLSFTKID